MKRATKTEKNSMTKSASAKASKATQTKNCGGKCKASKTSKKQSSAKDCN